MRDKQQEIKWQRKYEKKMADKGLKRMMVRAPSNPKLRKIIRKRVAKIVDLYFEKGGK